MEQWPLQGRARLLRRAQAHLRDHGGVVLAGVPWVGRTRILRELLSDASVETVLLRPSSSTSAVAFGGLGGLAPDDPSQPRGWLAAFADQLPGGPDTVVAVDGAHFLDDLSGAVLLEAAERRSCRLVLSVWAGYPAPEAVVNLWTDGLLPRLEVRPLDRAAVDGIVCDELAGPVEPATLQRLWEVCRGYPMLLREYLRGSLDAGVLTRDDGIWTLEGQLCATPALSDTARQIRAALNPAQRDALALVAVGEPLDTAVADALVEVSTLAELERQDLLELDAQGRYRLPAPGWSEAARLSLTSAERRALARRLASAAPPLERLDGAALVQVAGWIHDSGGRVAPRELARAAEVASALDRHGEAARLAAAVTVDVPVRSRLVLADVAARSGDTARAVDLLSEATAMAGDEDDRSRAAVTAGRLRAFRLHDPHGALHLLTERLERVTQPAARARIEAERALLMTLVDDLLAGIELAERVLAEPAADDESRLAAARAAGIGHAWSGSFEAAERALTTGAAIASRPSFARMAQVCALAQLVVTRYRGDEPNLEQIDEQYRAALARGWDGIAATWALQVAAIHADRGQLTKARARAEEAVRLTGRDDELRVAATAAATLAYVAGLAGDVGEARAALHLVEPGERRTNPTTSVLRDRAEAAVRAATDGLETAAELAVTASEDAARHGHRVGAALLLHDAARFGYADRAATGLQQLAGVIEGPLVAILRDHAVAVRDDDHEDLERVGARFLAAGLHVAAAESFAQAATTAAHRGRAGRANVLRARAAVIARDLDQVRTPALRGLGTEPLTRREREVALLAAGGSTSREIAQRLVVSPRTVDNHLANVYRKLGLAGRHELAEAFG